jgi:hypothetical protein
MDTVLSLAVGNSRPSANELEASKNLVILAGL